MSRRIYAAGALAAAAVAFVGINVLADATLTSTRLDLTQNKLYSLSTGTRNILGSLKDPIKLRLYYSERLAAEVPQLKLYGDRVRDLLQEYVNLSKGRISLEITDPEPFSEAEDAAAAAGIRGVPMDATGRNFYFGLVGTNLVDDRQVIGFFDQQRERFLEYDLTKLVYALTSPKKPKVALLTALPMEFGPGGMMAAMRGQSQPYAVLTQLRQQFDVQVMEGEIAEIPKDVDVVMLAYPKGLKPKAQYAVDQYLMRGGKVVAFLDPYSEVASTLPDPRTGQPPMGGDFEGSLPTLLTSLGVKLEPQKFVGDVAIAQRVQWGASAGGGRQVVDYIAWLNLPQANYAAADVVTGQLGNMNFASAGALSPVEGAKTTFVPLIQSTDQAALLDTKKLEGQPDPTALLREFKPTGTRYVLAARVSGPVVSAFPDGPPKDEAKPEGQADATPPAAPAAEHLKASTKDANVILVADSDLLDDRFWVRTQDFLGQRVAIPFASNADLVLNAIENMAGSSDLISLRGRAGSQRPFELIEQMRREANRRLVQQEAELKTLVDDTQKKITQLQAGAQAKGGQIATAETEKTLDEFRKQLTSARKQLREVQRALNADIERLTTTYTFVNIALVPILVAIAALGLAAVRRQKRRRSRRQAD